MSEVGHLQPAAKSFLDPYLPPNACDRSEHETRISNSQPPNFTADSPAGDADLPFVTLTYASSLDSMIALAPGARTTLSGPETKCMTHYLRLHHDAILIGAGTAAVDDPGLNCRYPEAHLVDQPQPIIVDPNGRWDPRGKKACRLADEGLGKPPWVICKTTIPESVQPLLKSGGDCLVIDEDETSPLTEGQPAHRSSQVPWLAILRALKRRGMQSIMIEGGATIINTLLAMPQLVNSVIITIAPTFLGQGGVVVSPAPKATGDSHTNAAWLENTSWRQFGPDVVLCGTLRSSEDLR